MIGIKVEGPSVLPADNEAVVKNTTLPSSTMKKRHNAIAYHKVREAVAANVVRVACIRTYLNVADILTKPLSPQFYYSILRMILFKRDSSDNQGELQQELTNRTENESHRTNGDSQALSLASENARDEESTNVNTYPEA